jgi:hypothetical protein
MADALSGRVMAATDDDAVTPDSGRLRCYARRNVAGRGVTPAVPGSFCLAAAPRGRLRADRVDAASVTVGIVTVAVASVSADSEHFVVARRLL